MPIIGLSRTALGDTDFVNAHTSAVRQISPLSVHTCTAAVIRKTLAVAITVPAKGTRRLCKKLPTTISNAAHRLPSAAARFHVWIACGKGRTLLEALLEIITALPQRIYDLLQLALGQVTDDEAKAADLLPGIADGAHLLAHAPLQNASRVSYPELDL
jgi:hypothetical protein